MARTRHASLAEQLSGLMAYRSRPPGVTPDEPAPKEIAPAQTNWRTIPGTAAPEDLKGLHAERRWRIKPSLQRIDAEINPVAEDGTPLEPEVEHNEAGQVVRIGSLRFSDGTQTEKAYKRTVDGTLIQYDARLPVGAMIGTDDGAREQLGADENPHEVSASNRYFAEMMGVEHRPYKSGGKRRRGKSYSAKESAAILAEAIENTDMDEVAVTLCPTGLPSGAPRVSESFVGMKKGSSAGSGAPPWEDVATALVNREVWVGTVAALTAKDRKVLDATGTAALMEDVGLAAGQSRLYARYNGGGRRALLAANDNILSALNKNAA